MSPGVRSRQARLERRRDAVHCPRCGSSLRRGGVVITRGDGPALLVCSICGRVPALIRRYLRVRVSGV